MPRRLRTRPVRPSCFRALVGLQDCHDCIQKVAFRQRTFKRLRLVDHRLGYGVDAILRNQIGKFRSLDAVGRDVLTFHCKLVRQADRPRAVRSGRRYKDLQMDWLVQLRKPFFALRAQAGIAL